MARLVVELSTREMHCVRMPCGEVGLMDGAALLIMASGLFTRVVIFDERTGQRHADLSITDSYSAEVIRRAVLALIEKESKAEVQDKPR